MIASFLVVDLCSVRIILLFLYKRSYYSAVRMRTASLPRLNVAGQLGILYTSVSLNFAHA